MCSVFDKMSTDSNDQDKQRRLPCRTFVSTGACPYRDRWYINYAQNCANVIIYMNISHLYQCKYSVYLHDPRIGARNAKSKTRKKTKEDVAPAGQHDLFFWPAMCYKDVRLKKDQFGRPAVMQKYVPKFRCAFYDCTSCCRNDSNTLQSQQDPVLNSM